MSKSPHLAADGNYGFLIVAFRQQSRDLHIERSQNRHNQNIVIVISVVRNVADKKTDDASGKPGPGSRIAR